MEITSVDATVHSIPVTAHSAEEEHESERTFVTVETNDGVTGYGETGVHHSESVATFVNERIAPAIEGSDPLRTGAVQGTVGTDPRVRSGVYSAAMSAVDIALWDVKGKRLGEPVWRLLGGASPTADVYVTLGVPSGHRDRLLDGAERIVSRWTDKLKMVVGRGDAATPALDAERVRAVREAVGDDIELAIDGNCKYSISETLDLCTRIEGENVAWFEEPIPGNNAAQLSDLRTRTRIPIAAGQFEGNRSSHRELIERRAIDLCQPNVCHVGGFTEATTVAATAASFDLDLCHGGGWPFQNMHLIAGLSNGWRLEYHESAWEVGKAIYESVPDLADGSITLPEEPGLGLTPDRAVLRETRVV